MSDTVDELARKAGAHIGGRAPGEAARRAAVQELATIARAANAENERLLDTLHRNANECSVCPDLTAANARIKELEDNATCNVYGSGDDCHVATRLRGAEAALRDERAVTRYLLRTTRDEQGRYLTTDGMKKHEAAAREAVKR